jgi:hypothetical protein
MGTETQTTPTVSIPDLLHVARMTYATVSAELEAFKEAVLKQFSEDHAELMKTVTTQQQYVADLDQAIRKTTMAHFEADPSKNKAPFPGVGIRVATDYIYEADDALNWAKEHRLCLALDAKAFKGVCKSDSTRPAFVEIAEVPIATIATDLGPVLGKEVSHDD